MAKAKARDHPVVAAVQERWPAIPAKEIAEAKDDVSALSALLELHYGYASPIAREEMQQVMAKFAEDEANPATRDAA
jgi:hypothetical protein